VNQSFETKQHWKDFRALLTECEKNIKLIETELIGQPAAFRAGKTAKLREYRKKYDQLKKATFEKENNWELEMGKKELIGGRVVSSEVIKSFDRSTDVSERLR
jgi:predicted aminopeptidase